MTWLADGVLEHLRRVADWPDLEGHVGFRWQGDCSLCRFGILARTIHETGEIASGRRGLDRPTLRPYVASIS